MPAKSKKTQTKTPTPALLPPKVDVVFKMLFGDKRNVNILKDFLEAVLHLEPNALKTIILRDPYLKKEYIEDKLSILDVKAELLDGKIVDIEIQVKNIPEMRSRVTYYNASMITEQIGEGGKYMDIKPAISIIITNYPFITESKKCHTIFQMLEKTERFQFNDLQEINVLDLTKIAAEKDEVLFDWLEFIKAEKEKDLMAVATRRPAIKQALNSLRQISADKKNRAIYESRLKGQRDLWSIEDAAEARGEARGRLEGEARAKQESAVIIAEKDNTLAEQARRIAELERLLSRK
ncbi:transposase [Fibrobacterales bacterium]|nr:transposase [Fibrobacterales bacterium]